MKDLQFYVHLYVDQLQLVNKNNLDSDVFVFLNF